MSGSMSVTVADLDPRIVVGEISSGALGLSTSDQLTSADFLSIAPLAPRAPASRRASRPAPEPAPVADPLVGAIVADRYRILELLGRGGMGAVYKVEHTRIGKLMAMKLLAGELSQSAEAERRFLREALTVSKLESPNTVQVFDFGVSNGLTYLVMELVNGDNLARLLRDEGPMPFPRLARIVIQLCSSLSEAHRKGIVHRDIKPENVMLVPTGRGGDLAKVLDFGLAKLRDGQAQDDVTVKGMILGTPNYMSPEQIRGEEVDARADVYAVGALMYRMITGQPLFTAASPLGILTKHLHEAPVPPITRAPDLAIPPAVSRIILRAVEKRPRDRHQRIEDLQAMLVAELRAAGSSSVDTLLDPGRLRAIEAEERAAVATRDEVDAYERKLRRTRWGAAFTAFALLGAAAGAAIAIARRDTPPSGLEIEPNNTAADATPLSLGHAMTGQLGKRLDASHGDRDFYAFDVPPAISRDSFVKLRVSALPNIAMCTMLYRSGFGDPVGTYCTGTPGRDLTIARLTLDPGRYFLAVVQDAAASAYIHESISDTYTILVESAAADPSAEVEPNDHRSSATPLAMSRPITAAIGWSRDEDFFCAPATTTGRFRWKVRAGLSEGAALEATPTGNGDHPPARIRLEESGAWQSPPIPADGLTARCLRIRLAPDPAHPARGIGDPYTVEAAPLP